jgi:hypothetical protein
MRKAFLKTLFFLTVLFFWMILLIPSMLVFQVLVPVATGSDGHNRGNPGMMGVVLIIIWICAVIADRMTSALFRFARLSDERWSVFKSRGRYVRPGSSRPPDHS